MGEERVALDFGEILGSCVEVVREKEDETYPEADDGQVGELLRWWAMSLSRIRVLQSQLYGSIR